MRSRILFPEFFRIRNRILRPWIRIEIFRLRTPLEGGLIKY